jgi:hypothetical protein
MGLHQTKKLLHSKGKQSLDSRDCPQNGRKPLSSDKGVITRIHRELKKLTPQGTNPLSK